MTWLEALAEGCEKKYVEGRVLELGIKQGREELAAEWKAIRRGWYLGGEQFRERMIELVEAPLLLQAFRSCCQMLECAA